MQIVIGLLCDEQGEPVSVDVFSGNIQDSNTVSCQIQKVTELFGCHHVIGRSWHGEKQTDTSSDGG